MKVWSDEQVSLMCQKSLFTYKYINQNQSGKIAGIDVRQQPEGHVIVSKDEQDVLLKSERARASSPMAVQSPEEASVHESE